MFNHKAAANTILAVLEEDFQFSAGERAEALLLALEILGDEELLEESEGTCELSYSR